MEQTQDVKVPSLPDDGERGGQPSEFPGRMAAAAGLAALFYAVWMLQLPEAADWPGRVLRIIPRLSVFGLSLFVALAVQGCRLKSSPLALGALMAGVGLLALQSSAEQFEILKLDADTAGSGLLKSRNWTHAGGDLYFHARPNMLEAGTALLLMRFECVLFTAIFLGTWIGRGAWSSWHFITLLAFGAICDVWSHWIVADGGEAAGLVATLRFPFVPRIGGLSGGPAFTDIVFASAVFESARGFRMHTLSLVLGALAGYCSGSFLGLDPTPAWTHLSMPLMACGILAAAWPDLKLDSNSIGKLFLAIALLILALCLLITLQHLLNPLPPHNDYPERRDTAHVKPRLQHLRECANEALWSGPKLAKPLRSIPSSNVPMYAIDMRTVNVALLLTARKSTCAGPVPARGKGNDKGLIRLALLGWARVNRNEDLAISTRHNDRFSIRQG